MLAAYIADTKDNVIDVLREKLTKKNEFQNMRVDNSYRRIYRRTLAASEFRVPGLPGSVEKIIRSYINMNEMIYAETKLLFETRHLQETLCWAASLFDDFIAYFFKNYNFSVKKLIFQRIEKDKWDPPCGAVLFELHSNRIEWVIWRFLVTTSNRMATITYSESADDSEVLGAIEINFSRIPLVLFNEI